MNLPRAAAACCLLFAPPASAASLVVEAGRTHALSADLVLTGADTLEIKGTAANPCALVGNRHRVRTGAGWTGSVKITHCTITGLGGLPKRSDATGLVVGNGPPAFDLKVGGAGDVTIEHCTLDACAAVHLHTDDDATAAFRHNTIRDTSVVAVTKNVEHSGDAFVAGGNSRGRKLFQGNFVARGKVVIRAPNWLVGGDTDADANLCVGYRIGIVADGAGTAVRGNYFHLLMPKSDEYPYWSQVSVFTTGRQVVGEHNVIRDGEWIVRFVEGEFRYNLVTDIIDHDLMQTGSYGRVHHNLFLAGDPGHWAGSMSACIMVVYPPKAPGDAIEIFNNVFDGGNRLDVPGIEVCPGGAVKSVRNNVFFNFAHKEAYFQRPQAAVRMLWSEAPAEEKPARLGYADYNLFHNPAAKTPRNYLLSVPGKVERKDAGFGLNDIPRGGKIDEQADPKFRGPVPKTFPFADEDIKARRVGVSQVLGFYRAAYTPAADSPLVGAGDPADGPGSYIGAVGAGPNPPADFFGRPGAR